MFERLGSQQGSAMIRTIRTTRAIAIAAAAMLSAAASAEIRVQDVASLQGSHANRLMGYGLVVGLPGTGDGAASPATLRALMQLHKVYHAPVLDPAELKANKNVAIVAVECVLPE